MVRHGAEDDRNQQHAAPGDARVLPGGPAPVEDAWGEQLDRVLDGQKPQYGQQQHAQVMKPSEKSSISKRSTIGSVGSAATSAPGPNPAIRPS